MSSPAASADVTPEKPTRKFPPPCWTQDEAMVLIDAYRERWHSLQRGYLRAADWDAVAEAVAERCPDAPTRKTPAQCRHKMEKLRQRHRAEKKRAASVPRASGRYYSTWFYFDKMEALEGGTDGNEKMKTDDDAPSCGGMKSLLDPSVVKLKLKARSDPDLGFGAGAQMNLRNVSVPSDGELFPDFTRLKVPTNGMPFTRHPRKLYHGAMNEDDERSRFYTSNNWNGDESYGLEQRDLSMSNKSKRLRRNPVDEIVASIQSLGEGYVKIERAKMELTREMEAMRMEMEMKRNKMMLDSQKQIIDAFVKGMTEIRNTTKKVKVSAAKLESAEAF